jgi:preprotein translocase subunit SecY
MIDKGNNGALGAGTIGAIGVLPYVSSGIFPVFTLVESTALDVESPCELWSIASD